MASTFSNLGLNLQGTGDNAGTWGAITNVNLQDIDNAISGVITVTVTGNTTLAFTTNSTSTTYTDEAGRNKTIILSGALSATTVTITVPNIEKDYYIINNSGATTIISSGGSTTVSIATGSKNIVIVNASATSVITALPTDQVNSPGGTTNAVQYNSAGSFAGSTNLTFDNTTLAIQTATALRLTVTSLTAITATTTTENVGNINLISNGVLKIYNTANTQYTGLQVLAAAATTVTFTLPSSDGTANQALITNGSASLSFTTVVTPTSTSTLTNKRIDPRVVSTASSTTVTPDISAADIYAFTALSTTLVIATPTGTPVDGNKLIFRILDNGTTRTLTWSTTYTAIGVTLPTATTANKTVYVGCIYNTNNTRWDAIAVTTQA
jgi:hypothetical protein